MSEQKEKLNEAEEKEITGGKFSVNSSGLLNFELTPVIGGGRLKIQPANQSEIRLVSPLKIEGASRPKIGLASRPKIGGAVKLCDNALNVSHNVLVLLAELLRNGSRSRDGFTAVLVYAG